MMKSNVNIAIRERPDRPELQQILRHWRASCLLLCIVLASGCIASCSNSGQTEEMGRRFRLAHYGYSSDAKTLLVAVYGSAPVPHGYFVTIDVVDSDIYWKFPLSPAPTDFAWNPRSQEYVVTHGDRISIFRDSRGRDKYKGTAVPSPINLHYRECAWNADGSLLAVRYMDYEDPPICKLGLYDAHQDLFRETEIHCASTPVWGEDNHLYVRNDEGVAVIEVGDGEVIVGELLPMTQDVMLHGVLNSQLLTSDGKHLRLGNVVLCELPDDVRVNIISTEAYVFVSSSVPDIVVFSAAGEEVARRDMPSRIMFGSVTERENMVYGLMGATVVEICVKEGVLTLTERWNLTKAGTVEMKMSGS